MTINQRVVYTGVQGLWQKFPVKSQIKYQLETSIPPRPLLQTPQTHNRNTNISNISKEQICSFAWHSLKHHSSKRTQLLRHLTSSGHVAEAGGGGTRERCPRPPAGLNFLLQAESLMCFVPSGSFPVFVTRCWLLCRPQTRIWPPSGSPEPRVSEVMTGGLFTH